MKLNLLGVAAIVATFMLDSPASAAIVGLNFAGMVTQETDLTGVGVFVGSNDIFDDGSSNIFPLNDSTGALVEENNTFTANLTHISNYSYDFYSDYAPFIYSLIIGNANNNRVRGVDE